MPSALGIGQRRVTQTQRACQRNGLANPNTLRCQQKASGNDGPLENRRRVNEMRGHIYEILQLFIFPGCMASICQRSSPPIPRKTNTQNLRPPRQPNNYKFIAGGHISMRTYSDGPAGGSLIHFEHRAYIYIYIPIAPILILNI